MTWRRGGGGGGGEEEKGKRCNFINIFVAMFLSPVFETPSENTHNSLQCCHTDVVSKESSRHHAPSWKHQLFEITALSWHCADCKGVLFSAHHFFFFFFFLIPFFFFFFFSQFISIQNVTPEGITMKETNILCRYVLCS